MRNRYQPHILVLPEDDANRQLANGFVNCVAVDQNKIQVLKPAGGWTHVRDEFLSNHVADMERYPQRFMILLIDFDGNEARRQEMRIPPNLKDRVFVIGVLSEAEDLKASRSFEEVGFDLAENCTIDRYTAWEHRLRVWDIKVRQARFLFLRGSSLRSDTLGLEVSPCRTPSSR